MTLEQNAGKDGQSLLAALRTAAALQRQGQGSEALHKCHAILERFPEQPDALQLLAVLHAQAGNHPEALQCFARAATAAPERTDILANHANALLEHGDAEAALALCRQALVLDEGRFDAHNVLGNVLLARRQWEAAEAAFRRALQLKPDFRPAWNSLASLLWRLRRGEESADAYRKALQLQPDDPAVLTSLGQVCRGLGHISEASRCFERALQLRPDPRLAALAAEVSPLWLEPLQGKTVTLRRYEEQDAAWLRNCFGDAAFMQQYHRYLPGARQGSGLRKRLRALQALHPAKTRTLDWVIVARNGERLGMANLVDIEFTHRRAELLLGIPQLQHQTRGYGLEALLLVLEFVFNRVGLNKLTNLVYADNRRAQENVEHAGFVREGVLRQHVFDRHSGMLIDICCNGMTRDDFKANVRLARLALRRLGRDITQGG